MPSLKNLQGGSIFRFDRDTAFGSKAAKPGAPDDSVILVLTPTKTGLQPGELVSHDISDVTPLRATIVPSVAPDKVTPGKHNFAQLTELNGMATTCCSWRGLTVKPNTTGSALVREWSGAPAANRRSRFIRSGRSWSRAGLADGAACTHRED
jgi:hypothetical protein